MTDVAIKEVFGDDGRLNIVWQPSIFLPYHPNGMKFTAYDEAGNTCGEWTVYSVGGGALSEGNNPKWLQDSHEEVYEKNSLSEIMDWCNNNGRNYWEYVKESENSDIWDYLM